MQPQRQPPCKCTNYSQLASGKLHQRPTSSVRPVHTAPQLPTWSTVPPGQASPPPAPAGVRHPQTAPISASAPAPRRLSPPNGDSLSPGSAAPRPGPAGPWGWRLPQGAACPAPCSLGVACLTCGTNRARWGQHWAQKRCHGGIGGSRGGGGSKRQAQARGASFTVGAWVLGVGSIARGGVATAVLRGSCKAAQRSSVSPLAHFYVTAILKGDEHTNGAWRPACWVRVLRLRQQAACGDDSTCMTTGLISLFPAASLLWAAALCCSKRPTAQLAAQLAAFGHGEVRLTGERQSQQKVAAERGVKQSWEGRQGRGQQ